MWRAAGLPDRESAEARLGLAPCGLRIGVVGAPRHEKLVQTVLDAVAACSRDDVQLACWSLSFTDRVPDDPRIVVAEQYRGCDPRTYATRLAACDVLALVFDPAGEMLATGTIADAIGAGIPVLGSDWPFLEEMLGGALLRGGHTVESLATAIDALTPDRVDEARAMTVALQPRFEWDPIAARTADLFERVVLRRP
jgi:hypothetical protein